MLQVGRDASICVGTRIVAGYVVRHRRVASILITENGLMPGKHVPFSRSEQLHTVVADRLFDRGVTLSLNLLPLIRQDRHVAVDDAHVANLLNAKNVVVEVEAIASTQ
jgi:hypothetical protein